MGEKTLTIAAAVADVATTRMLLEIKADVNDGTALRSAAVRTDGIGGDMIRLLVKHQADIDQKGADGKSALVHAILYAPSTDNAKLLLELKASPHYLDGDEPMIAAIQSHNISMVKLLRAYGGDCTSFDVLATAAKDAPDMLSYLVEQKADIHIRDLRNDSQPIWFYACAEGIRMLIAWGAEVNARDDQDKTALHVNSESLEAVEALLEAKADVNARNIYGAAPLHQHCDPAIVELLVQHGADIEARDSRGRTPLFRQSDGAGIVALLQARANIEATLPTGQTPVQAWHSQGGSGDEVVALLLQHGADPFHFPTATTIDVLPLWRQYVCETKLSLCLGLHERVGRHSSLRALSDRNHALGERRVLQHVFAFAFSRDPSASSSNAIKGVGGCGQRRAAVKRTCRSAVACDSIDSSSLCQRYRYAAAVARDIN